MPWDRETLDEWCQNHQRSVISENRGYNDSLTISAGWSWAGPTSPEKLSVETERLYAVYRSISEKGYLRHDGPDGDILAALPR